MKNAGEEGIGKERGHLEMQTWRIEVRETEVGEIALLWVLEAVRWCSTLKVEERSCL